jgi:hypothetical protein
MQKVRIYETQMRGFENKICVDLFTHFASLPRSPLVSPSSFSHRPQKIDRQCSSMLDFEILK